ncbi:MAG: chloride channel protein, partial [Caldimonas sp.]
EQRSSGLLVAAIVLAGLMAVSVYGNSTYFGVIQVPAVGWSLLGPGVLVALLSGVAGGLFSRLLLRSLTGSGERILEWRRRHPVVFAAGCGGAVALIALATDGATRGSGYQYTRGLLDGTHSAPVVYAFSKFIATWLTAWSGVPGGLFAPALAIGAGLGNDIALMVGNVDHAALIALGMVGFLAAVTHAPLTSFIIVMEMIDGHAMVLSLMACALIASLVSRLLGPPLYSTLAQAQLVQLPPTAPHLEPPDAPRVEAAPKGPAGAAPGR